MPFSTLDALVVDMPPVQLQRLPHTGRSAVAAKLEGNNPAGSVKDRPALGVIRVAVSVVLERARESEDSAVVTVVCDRGHRCPSTGPFNKE